MNFFQKGEPPHEKEKYHFSILEPNHLGNVMEVVSDRKIAEEGEDVLIYEEDFEDATTGDFTAGLETTLTNLSGVLEISSPNKTLNAELILPTEEYELYRLELDFIAKSSNIFNLYLKLERDGEIVSEPLGLELTLGSNSFAFEGTGSDKIVGFSINGTSEVATRWITIDNVKLIKVGDGRIDHFLADVVQYSDYYPYGMTQPGRNGSIGSKYRYAFNGMEVDQEVSGSGNSYTTQFRQYDPRLGRWKSLDPLAGKYPNASPFCAFNDNPIFFVDPLGLEGVPGKGKGRRGKKGGSANKRAGLRSGKNKRTSGNKSNPEEDKSESDENSGNEPAEDTEDFDITDYKFEYIPESGSVEVEPGQVISTLTGDAMHSPVTSSTANAAGGAPEGYEIVPGTERPDPNGQYSGTKKAGLTIGFMVGNDLTGIGFLDDFAIPIVGLYATGVALKETFVPSGGTFTDIRPIFAPTAPPPTVPIPFVPTGPGIEELIKRLGPPIILYRGVAVDHPGYDAAKLGIAVPQGGHDDPYMHNWGDTESVFTSWTSNYSLASVKFARAGGIVLVKVFWPGLGELVPSPDTSAEGEWLVPGAVYGAFPIHQ